MVSYEGTAIAKASPEAVFAAWTNVDGWTDVEQIQSVTIDGPFREGAVIRSKAKGSPRVTLTVTSVDPACWVDESRMPGLRMRFDHVIQPVADGTSITERVTITGPLARVVGPFLRKQMIELFAASTRTVAAQAEAAETAG